MNRFDVLYKTNPLISELREKIIFLTGATGTIGSRITEFIRYLNREHNYSIKLLCPVRSIARVDKQFLSDGNIKWFEYDCMREIPCDDAIDYAIHLAGPTKSRTMIDYPVDTINAIVTGTRNVLEFCRKNGCLSCVYVSSIEVYGDNSDETIALSENSYGKVDQLNIRSNYPESKRLAENMCMAYFKQYGLNVKIARLGQILADRAGDTRLISYLCNCARKKEQITLRSDGEAVKSYCGIDDCISALIYILLKGEPTAYNVASADITLSVREIAEYFSEKYIKKSVIIENRSNEMYPKSSYLKLNVDKLYGLGWKPGFGFDEIVDGLICNAEDI